MKQSYKRKAGHRRANKVDESILEEKLKAYAGWFNCKITKIPDVVATKENLKKRKNGKGYTIAAKERPCDIIFSCCYGNAFIELKWMYNSLEDHQFKFLKEIEHLNGLAFVIRGRQLKRGIVYSIENNERSSDRGKKYDKEIIFETQKIEEIFEKMIQIIKKNTKKQILAI